MFIEIEIKLNNRHVITPLYLFLLFSMANNVSILTVTHKGVSNSFVLTLCIYVHYVIVLKISSLQSTHCLINY